MKALIVPYVPNAAGGVSSVWTEEFFPGKSLLHLPVAGKAWVEYLLDWCNQQKVTDVLILDYEFDEHVLSYHIGTGARWGLNVVYRGTDLIPDQETLLKRNRAFIGDDKSVVIWGALFPCAEGLREVPSLQDWFELNFEILQNPGSCVLPGYSAEAGVYTGMNVVLKTGRLIAPPVFLDDNVRIEYGVRLLGDVLIGTAAVVDKGTTLHRTIVFPHTYIGLRTEFSNKVVYGSRVIDPYAGVYVDLEESGISARIRSSFRPDYVRIWEWFLALVLTSVLTPLWLLFFPFRRSPWIRALWLKLSLDRYPAILQTLCGMARLVRSSSADTVSAFTASDAIAPNRTPDEQKIDERYFRHNRTVSTVAGIVMHALVNRFLFDTEGRPRE